jgi:hypothetical protein
MEPIPILKKKNNENSFKIIENERNFEILKNTK